MELCGLPAALGAMKPVSAAKEQALGESGGADDDVDGDLEDVESIHSFENQTVGDEEDDEEGEEKEMLSAEDGASPGGAAEEGMEEGTGDDKESPAKDQAFACTRAPPAAAGPEDGSQSTEQRNNKA